MMKRLLSVGILLGLILLGCSVVQVGGNENTYFPRAEGNKWVYEVEGYEGIYYVTAQMVEVKPGTYVWFIEDNQSENSNSMLIETEDNIDPLNDSTEFVVDSALGINIRIEGGNNRGIHKDPLALRSIIFSGDNTDPLDDTTEIVVDSALGITGVRPLFILQKDSKGAVVLDMITTPVGSFSEYLRIEGDPCSGNIRYDAWLIPDIGPVEVHQWTEDEVVKRFRLIEFIPAES